jgi:hypothetical protein
MMVGQDILIRTTRPPTEAGGLLAASFAWVSQPMNFGATLGRRGRSTREMLLIRGFPRRSGQRR